jgi:hypothetical protein
MQERFKIQLKIVCDRNLLSELGIETSRGPYKHGKNHCTLYLENKFV